MTSTISEAEKADMQARFTTACIDGCVESVRTLLADPRVDPCACRSLAFHRAVYHGHVQVVQMLLADGRADPCLGGIYAVTARRPDGLVELIERNEAMWIACLNGNVEVVRALLADGRAGVPGYRSGSAVIRSASARGFVGVVRLLLTDSRAVCADAVGGGRQTKKAHTLRACLHWSAWFSCLQ